MNRSELREIILGRLREFDQMYRRGSEKAKLESTVEIWTDAFMEYRNAPNFEEAFDKAMLEHVKMSKFFPVPAEVLNMMGWWVRKEPEPVEYAEAVSGQSRERRRIHNSQVAQAIRLAIMRDSGKRREGLNRLMVLKVIDEAQASRYMGNNW